MTSEQEGISLALGFAVDALQFPSMVFAAELTKIPEFPEPGEIGPSPCAPAKPIPIRQAKAKPSLSLLLFCDKGISHGSSYADLVLEDRASNCAGYIPAEGIGRRSSFKGNALGLSCRGNRAEEDPLAICGVVDDEATQSSAPPSSVGRKGNALEGIRHRYGARKVPAGDRAALGSNKALPLQQDWKQ